MGSSLSSERPPPGPAAPAARPEPSVPGGDLSQSGRSQPGSSGSTPTHAQNLDRQQQQNNQQQNQQQQVPVRRGASAADVPVQACSRFRYADLEEATNSFSSSNVIGEGGFGKVYKGTLRDGTHIAVKCLDPLSQQGDHEFYSEVGLLTRLRHPNLVCMMGMCDEAGKKLGVFEYMPRGSLRELLDRGQLSWADRMEIAVGIARGLYFLHEISQPPCIHNDFKSANVLIDAYGQAHVSDFGLARYVGGLSLQRSRATMSAVSGESTNVTTVTSIRGTFGYLSPEYLEQGQASIKADVFAFGVVLLELLTGQEAVDVRRGRGDAALCDWARPFLGDPDRVKAILQPAVASEALAVQIAVLSEVVEACLRRNPRERPSMLDVVRAVSAAQKFIEERTHHAQRSGDGAEAQPSVPEPSAPPTRLPRLTQRQQEQQQQQQQQRRPLQPSLGSGVRQGSMDRTLAAEVSELMKSFHLGEASHASPGLPPLPDNLLFAQLPLGGARFGTG